MTLFLKSLYAFRYKGTEDRPGGAVFEEGMVTTDEPGIYIEGKYGIRLENELVCQGYQQKDKIHIQIQGKIRKACGKCYTIRIPER